LIGCIYIIAFKDLDKVDLLEESKSIRSDSYCNDRKDTGCCYFKEFNFQRRGQF